MPETPIESNPLDVLTTVDALKTPQSVTRNGVTKVLHLFTGKREGWKDKPFQAPQIRVDINKGILDDEAFIEDLTFFGKGVIKNIVDVMAKRGCQDYAEDAIGEKGTPNEGKFQLDVFLNSVANFAASAMKLSELNELYQAEVQKFTDYTSVTFITEMESDDAERIAAAKAQMNSMRTTLNALKIDLDTRKARRSKEANVEAVTA